MPISITPARKCPTIEDVILFEMKINTHLPIYYRNFLVKYGAARPESNSLDGKGDIGVRSFLAPGTGEYSISERIQSLNATEQQITCDYIPIADDGVGNYILMELINGTIWFWDHELYPNKATYMIANSFEDFIERLTPLADADQPSTQILSVTLKPDFAKKFGKQG